MGFPKSTIPARILTEGQKTELRRLLTEGKIPRTELAAMYNCSPNQINGIWSQMVQKRNKIASKQIVDTKKASVMSSKPAVVSTKGRRVVRIDASNFDEVVVANGDNEISIQISS